ncbi:cysteine desulfurase family protein [Methanolobus sediminis]|uniref:cysteine desulfurase n=1 Tax=Methanolobus sediminis TaxID=3072978 RepID=A0AA51UM96_9EURY|nr:cysteine desulfurase family protein [Methanolobus sediminis]WMW25965.1 cysteine desulfurase family protein [Methanolobus sediminis]
MIYADNAATTKVSDSALERMLPFLQEHYGNASSQYSFGIKAKRAIEQARQQVATAIGAEPDEIVFTSGGSESNSWVLSSVVSGHVITSSIEHHSLLNSCYALERKGIDVTYLPVDKTGLISATSVKKAIRPDTKLVSIMLANNEIGTIQPIIELGPYLRERNIIFHTDAVQAVGHIPVNVKELGVDLLSASAHKFNGAKGTGILYKQKNLSLPSLIFGGEQERGARAGTENVAGIVAAGYALEESIVDMYATTDKLTALVRATVDGISTKIPNITINGDRNKCLPGIVNILFEGITGESLMHLLDLKGICVSTSSACASGKNEASHVLRALGLSEQQAKSAIRISYGRYNTMHDVNAIVAGICDAYMKITAVKS